jgi:phytoene synthase
MHDTNHDKDIAECRQLLRGGSRSFYAASLVLPRGMRRSATALYAFCRLADDAIDSGEDTAQELRLLSARLNRIYSSRPDDHPADRAFAAIVVEFGIPRSLPLALLDGFQWDSAGRRYESLEELCDYAARVAGSVGVMMTLLMLQREPQVLARASDLGVAMQLTNIARDVGEDARAGRLYLPLRWLREAGIDPEQFLRAPAHSPALAGVVQRLLAVAQALYDRSTLGIAHLPGRCRFGINAARMLYCEIGNEVARRNFDPITQRAVVPAATKLRVLIGAAVATFAVPQVLQTAALPETQFLIDAVRASRAVPEPDVAADFAPPWWRVRARMLRLIDLFERLERREQVRQLAAEEGRVTQWGS